MQQTNGSPLDGIQMGMIALHKGGTTPAYKKYGAKTLEEPKSD